MPKKEEEREFRQIWISQGTFRKLMQVKYALYKKDQKARNPDAVIKELIEFCKKHQS